MDWHHETLLSNPVEAYVEEIRCIFLPRNKSIYIPYPQGEILLNTNQL